MVFLKFAVLFSALVQFLLLFWLFIKKKYNSLAERLFILFILNGCLYCFFMFLFMIEIRIDFAILKLNIAIYFSSIYILFALLFSSSLSNNKIGHGKIFYTVITICFAIYFWNNIVKTIEIGKWGWYPITNPVPTIIQLIFLILGILITCLNLNNIEKTLEKSKKISLKKRIAYFRYSMFSLCILSFAIVLFNFLNRNKGIPVIFPAFFFIPSLIMTYALIKKK